jgi:hypothetical protein
VDRATTVMGAERARPPRARDPVKAYQTIARELKSSKFRVPSSGLENTTHQTIKK